MVIDLRFDDVFDFREGLARVKVEDKWGFIDSSGEFVIEPIFPSFDRGPGASDFACGVAIVWTGKVLTFITHDGRQAFTPFFDGADDFSEGLAAVRIGDKVGFTDTQGRLTIPATYEGASRFREGFAWVDDGQVIRCVRPSGDAAFAQTSDLFARDFSEGLAGINIGSYMGFVSSDGRMAIPPVHTWVGDFSEGLAPFVATDSGSGGKLGYLDTSGRIAIPPTYDEADSFSEGLALVRPEPRAPYAFVDCAARRRVVLDSDVEFASPFYGGLAMVLKKKVNTSGYAHGYVDAKGNYVWTPHVE